jgi:hypothetical protein
MPPSVSLDEYERLAVDARRIADRFVALFERYVVGADYVPWQPFCFNSSSAVDHSCLIPSTSTNCRVAG